MAPPDEKRHPAAGPSGAPEIDNHGDGIDVSTVPRWYDRRREAALRCEPLSSGRRDPLFPPFRWVPTTFGLSQRELAAEIERCQLAGWQRWEIRQTFILPREMEVAA